jgi:hypothetical protein
VRRGRRLGGAGGRPIAPIAAQPHRLPTGLGEYADDLGIPSLQVCQEVRRLAAQFGCTLKYDEFPVNAGTHVPRAGGTLNTTELRG